MANRSIEFTCKLCNNKHPAIEKDENGVYKLPSTITTQRDSQLCWFFCCIECPKESA